MDQLLFTVIALCITLLGGVMLGWNARKEHEAHMRHPDSGQHLAGRDE